MKRYSHLAFALATTCLLTGTAVMAQESKEQKEAKEVKEPKEKVKQYDELIIRKNTNKDEKVVIEIKDGDVFVNGKPMEDFENDNISIRRSKTGRTVTLSPFRSPSGLQSFEYNNLDQLKTLGTRAFLGVTTEEAPGGARINAVTKNSAAEKAGLKAKDIITKIDGEKVQDENDVSRLIRAHKPEDKVKIDLLRDGKETSVSAVLGKTQDQQTQGFNFSIPDVDLQYHLDTDQFPKNFEFGPYGPARRPRLGIKAQDTESGEGVKVVQIEHESPAEKSGIEEDDIITEFNNKKVNSADELASQAAEAKDKNKIPVKILRDGKTVTLDLVIPKKLKTANL